MAAPEDPAPLDQPTAETETETEVVEVPAGLDLGTLEVVLARLRSDGIPARVEPDLTGVIPDETDGGYRILLRRDDLEAARPVLETAEITIPPEIQ